MSINNWNNGLQGKTPMLEQSLLMSFSHTSLVFVVSGDVFKLNVGSIRLQDWIAPGWLDATLLKFDCFALASLN